MLSPLAVTFHSGETWFKPNCDRPSLHTHGRIKNKEGSNKVWGEDLLPNPSEEVLWPPAISSCEGQGSHIVFLNMENLGWPRCTR